MCALHQSMASFINIDVFLLRVQNTKSVEKYKRDIQINIYFCISISGGEKDFKMLKNVEDNYAIYKRRRNALPIQIQDKYIQIQDEETEHISNSEAIIVLNVGGTRYEILKKNFAYWPTTRLSKMVRAKTKEDILKYCDGVSEFPSEHKPSEYYFTHNWSNFNSILDK